MGHSSRRPALAGLSGLRSLSSSSFASQLANLLLHLYQAPPHHDTLVMFVGVLASIGAFSRLVLALMRTIADPACISVFGLNRHLQLPDRSFQLFLLVVKGWSSGLPLLQLLDLRFQFLDLVLQITLFSEPALTLCPNLVQKLLCSQVALCRSRSFYEESIANFFHCLSQLADFEVPLPPLSLHELHLLPQQLQVLTCPRAFVSVFRAKLRQSNLILSQVLAEGGLQFSHLRAEDLVDHLVQVSFDMLLVADFDLPVADVDRRLR
mmetsp:Transcript_75415/g.180151  ORF Transcript_75415/g.180151 Transcript_75415/m.180151 type:complete len:265 (-) Transcript_75415:162-956(-)